MRASSSVQIPPDIQGLVFDCDGTIADTMPLHYQAWVTALNEQGYAFSEAMFYELAGVPTARIIELINERHGRHMLVQETAERKESLFVKLIPQAAPIEPVVGLVHEFAGKLPMAVATGATRAICLKTLDALGLTGHFQAIVTADDVTHGKPAPDIFLEAARRLSVDPKRCYAFEDGELGLQSARAAGMFALDIRPLRRQLEQNIK